MNQIQRRIFLRLILSSVMVLALYIIAALYIQRTIDEEYLFQIIAVISLIYVMIIGLIWIRQRNLYGDYGMEKRIKSGKKYYILCPDCHVIQNKGRDSCKYCYSQWIICQVCEVPFEDGSSVMIAPCCGRGFHQDHFESALREHSSCPFCGSQEALVEANW